MQKTGVDFFLSISLGIHMDFIKKIRRITKKIRVDFENPRGFGTIFTALESTQKLKSTFGWKIHMD